MRRVGFSVAMGTVMGVTVLSTTLFILQGGFGAGHLDYDRLLGILAMPWLFVPWPDAVYRSGDFTWLIAIPLILNSFCVWMMSRLL